MRDLEIALIEWPNGREAGGPRVVGRIADARLVASVKDHLAAVQRRGLARLEPPARLVRDDDRRDDRDRDDGDES